MISISTIRRFFLGCLAGCMALCLTGSAVYAADAGTAAPPADFVLRSLTGANIRLSELRGSVVLLGFWARWCGECRQAMQALNQVHAKYERAGLVILGIDVDDTAEQAATMARSLELNYPILLDTDKSASNGFNLTALPLLLLIDRDGQIRYRHAGYERGQDLTITEQLRQLLNE